jgi:hypothetical protein
MLMLINIKKHIRSFGEGGTFLIALRILIVLIAGEGLFNILAHNFAVGE